MNVLEAIHARRSVRSYSPAPVARSTLEGLLDAAVHAPSAMNQQPWVFAVVQDRARLRRYSDTAKAMLLARAGDDPKAASYRDRLRSDSFDIFYDAGTLVVIGVASRGPYSDADAWLAAGHLLLAACDAGLGTCCIGFAVPVLNTPEALADLGFPPAGVAIAPIIVGYAHVSPPPVARASAKILSWLA